MQIYQVKEAKIELIEDFIHKNERLFGKKLTEESYVVEVDGSIEGCFNLEKVDESTYWLKQLYLNKEHVQKLFVVFESVLVISRKNDIKCVYVHNQSPVVDILLESLQFKRESDVTFKNINSEKTGNWWAYQVS
ncbi:hypothetical protein [Oceanobacillus sojae]|uniref:hypothetical protein n=1 Tax=Oceanobacillus sojae TaxID=582851 RepID=UPI0021A6DF99|nr:hypothetical protein [Oceanobacillus sojae]MCT1901185.1 hypothetical protein [Oceanobacillus sojae]